MRKVRYKLMGYNFNAHDIFLTFDNKTITTPIEVRKEIVKSCLHISRFIQKLFIHSAEIILLDIIENSHVFHLPRVNRLGCVLKIITYREEEVVRKNLPHILKGLDFSKTFFTAPMLKLQIDTRGRKREINVTFSDHLRQKLIDKANSGFIYKEGKDVDIDYYVDKVKEAFPKVEKSDIKKILYFGWKGVVRFLGYRGEVQLYHKGFFVHFGSTSNDKTQLLQLYLRKLSLKVRIMSNRKKFPYDGYSYFWLSPPRYKLYCETGEIDRVVLFKFYEVCYLDNNEEMYIMRVKMIETPSIVLPGYLIKENLEVELYEKRSRLTLNNIKVTKGRFKILTAKPLLRKRNINGKEKHN